MLVPSILVLYNTVYVTSPPVLQISVAAGSSVKSDGVVFVGTTEMVRPHPLVIAQCVHSPSSGDHYWEWSTQCPRLVASIQQ